MWIKICANTNLEDSLLATELGADALGFVFAESARRVTPAQTAEIVACLPHRIEKIGVFSGHGAEEIVAVVREAGLTGVQLHGGFNLALARALRETLPEPATITQTLHWAAGKCAGNGVDVAAQLADIAAEPAVDRVLLDSKTGNATGGTGMTFDWQAAHEKLLSGSMKPIRMIVAGGLGPENVAQAVAQLNPWGVDVASGVEMSPGKKDPAKLRQFIENARTSR